MILRSLLREWPVWQSSGSSPRRHCRDRDLRRRGCLGAGIRAVPLGDLRLCAVFARCGATSVKLTRRAEESRPSTPGSPL
jgi:hypothetical protein